VCGNEVFFGLNELPSTVGADRRVRTVAAMIVATCLPHTRVDGSVLETCAERRTYRTAEACDRAPSLLQGAAFATNELAARRSCISSGSSDGGASAPRIKDHPGFHRLSCSKRYCSGLGKHSQSGRAALLRLPARMPRAITAHVETGSTDIPDPPGDGPGPGNCDTFTGTG